MSGWAPAGLDIDQGHPADGQHRSLGSGQSPGM